MTILFIGDVVGRPGRRAVTHLLPQLRDQYRPDFVIVNAENAAAGYGITQSTASELLGAGADCLTTGNHVWAQKEAYELLNRDPRILRPANFAPGVPGHGSWVYPAGKAGAVGVINLIGRVFMDPADCPFRTAAALLEPLRAQCNAVIVDFHAEATSEKAAFGRYLDGRLTAVLGTHTHVQTADERILPGGTAFITDVGMTGPTESIIGAKVEIIVNRFLNWLPARFDVPKAGPAVLSGVVIETEGAGPRAKTIVRFQTLTDDADAV